MEKLTFGKLIFSHMKGKKAKKSSDNSNNAVHWNYIKILSLLIVFLVLALAVMLNDNRISGYAATQRPAYSSPTTISTCSDGTAINSCSSNGQKCAYGLPSEVEAEIKIISDDTFKLYVSKGFSLDSVDGLKDCMIRNECKRVYDLASADISSLEHLREQRKIGQESNANTVHTYKVKLKQDDVIVVSAIDNNGGESTRKAGLKVEIKANGKLIEKTDNSWKVIEPIGSLDYLAALANDFDDSRWQQARAGYRSFAGFEPSTQSIWLKDKAIVLFRKKISLQQPSLKGNYLIDSCSQCGCPAGKACSNEKCLEFVPSTDRASFESGMLQESEESCLSIADTNAKDFCLDYVASQRKDASICSFISTSERQNWCVEKARVFAAGKVIISSGDTSRVASDGISESSTIQISAPQEVPIYSVEAYYCNNRMLESQNIAQYLSTCEKISEIEIQKIKQKDQKFLTFKQGTYNEVQSKHGLVFKFDVNKPNVEIQLTFEPKGTRYLGAGSLYRLKDNKKWSNGLIDTQYDESSYTALGQTQLDNQELFLFVPWKTVGIDEIKITKTW